MSVNFILARSQITWVQFLAVMPNNPSCLGATHTKQSS